VRLAGAAVGRYVVRPDPSAAGLLLHGADPGRVAAARRRALDALLGPGAEEEMRLTRLPAADLRRDPAALQDAMRASGFFPGARAVLVEDATDGLTPLLADALAAQGEEDARIVVTAALLPARSKLRKLFEGHPSARSAALYDDPPSRAEVEAGLATQGVTADRDALARLEALAAEMGPGAFARLVETLALLRHGEEGAASEADVAAVAPASGTAAPDALAAAVAEGRAAEVTPLLRRLAAQGTGAVAMVLALARHFRAIHAAAARPGGVAALRTPVHGPRRDALVRQARLWGPARAETALGVLVETDLALRSAGARAPDLALVERALIRIAMMART
jgi:DNA polymerase-3 subunit delta